MSDTARLETIADIGIVADACSATEAADKVVEGEIIAVLSPDEYPSGLKCKAKFTTVSPIMAECYKCGAKFKLNKCPLNRTALIVVEEKSGTQHRVTVFN